MFKIKMVTSLNADVNMKKLNHLYVTGGNVKNAELWNHVLVISYETKHSVVTHSITPLFILLKGKFICIQSHIKITVHGW